MNWSRAKLIFILAFLVLDLFLGVRLYQKRMDTDDILPVNELTMQERLQNNNIKIPSDLPNIQSAAYITGTAKPFGSKGVISSDITPLAENGKGERIQKLTVTSNGRKLISQFLNKIKVPEDHSIFLQSYVYRGVDYHFWKKSDVDQSQIFVQTFHDRPVFSKSKSQTGSLKIWVKNHLVIRYQQTYLDFKDYTEKKDIIQPLKALDKLWNDNDLPMGSEVETIELGYYNMIEQEAGESKVFVPVWHIIVKPDGSESHEYFVNALTGTVQTLEDENAEAE